MVDTRENILQLIAALEKRDVCNDVIQETITNILLHKVDLIYWNDADKERIILHAYLLARTKSLLQDSLATDLNSNGREIIERHIREINEHFSMHQWPTDIPEDDPALLKQLWHQQNISIAATRQFHDNVSHTALIPGFRSESNRILRILLKLPATVSTQGEFEPVVTRDLVTALLRRTDRFVKAVVEEELQARYPAAYDFLVALYGRRYIAKLDGLLDLKRMSSQGFSKSMAQSKDALRVLIDNLTIARNVLGTQEFFRITGSWDTLNKIQLVAVLDIHTPGVNLGGYQLAYPVEYSESQMPPWMKDSTLGELNSKGNGDTGTYILFSDNMGDASFNDGAKEQLHAQYTNIQNNLIKPNYDALQLIIAHSDKMTKMTARTIVSLLATMVEAYQQVATPADGDSVLKQYNGLLQDLDRSWEDLSHNSELPVFLKNKITKIKESSLADINSVHSLIRFLHEAGNKALEKKMVSARADMTITIGRIGTNGTKNIQLVKLDNAPIIVNGLIRHRAIATIVRASRRMPEPIPGTFVVINNYIIYSVKLGEHRVEFSANIEHPDNEGFVRLQSYQGGIEIEQQLRGAFIEKVLKERGMAVKCEQDGLVDSLVRGILDKDHGARTEKQIEQTVILVLRLIWSLRDLDYAMAYIFLPEILSGGSGDKIDPDKINQFVTSFARMFIVEGMIPFSYRGEGMPFATYCEYSGPKTLREFKTYHSDEPRMIRYRLYFTINALLQAVELPTIQPGTGGVGQEVIDEYFNKPLRNALGRRELKLNARGFVERNPSYQPFKEIISTIITHENEALRMAVLLKMTNLHLDFSTIGSIDQLTLMRAQQEMTPNEWLVVYGLADDENRVILYAFSQYLTAREGGEWLSIAGLRNILRKAGYSVPARIQVPGFQKVVSHRLLIRQPREQSRIIGTSVRGLLASVGDGSVRIGRITFDRNYCFNPQTRDGRVLLVPFTTPEDIEAIRAAEAILVTSGGLLSHAGVTTREFAIPALILPHAEWVQSSEGVMVRLEERYPGRMRKTAEGFWVSDSMVSETVDVCEGDMVLVWASQGIVSIMPIGGDHLEQAHGLIQGIVSGEKTSIDLECWLASVPLGINAQDNREQITSDTLGLVLAEALWDKRINPTVRKQLIDVVQHACTGIRVDGKTVGLPAKSAAYINMVMQRLQENAFMELEELLSEIEHNISRVKVLWRALNIIAVVERLWAQVMVLSKSLNLSDRRLQAFENRIDQLRRHPRIALLRASVLHEIEVLSERNLTEKDLPLIRQTLRRLGHRRIGSRHQKVLLVCTANVDRSPMAEFLLKKMLHDEKIRGVEVISRGVAALENCPMSEISQALLISEDGMHAETHRSRRIEEIDVREANIILTMECFHAQFLKEKYPHAVGKIFLLSDYGNARALGDIKDPAGQLGDAYYQMKREVQVSLTGVFKRMREEGVLAKAMVAHLQIKADELTRVKRKRVAESQRSIIPMEDVDADSVELVGGKGANLGEIAYIVKYHGAQVPQALMVTTFAFQRFLEENHMLEAYARITAAIDTIIMTKTIPDEDHHRQIVELSEQIRNLIFQGNLDVATGLGLEIMEAVDSHGLQNTYLSVRSSGLQEDTEEATFAGAAETYLYVNPTELLEWIKKVWMSFWLVRGILYRNSRIIQQGLIKPAVIVQKMFDSQVSGVMFTTDPVSGRDVIVIEAGYGLGDGVVSGLVDVDRYYVNKFDGSVINIHIGKKAFKVTQHPSGKGTSIESVDNDLRDVPCLNEEDIKVKIAMALEEHYALSQDIEFGIADGKVSILQTRPITTRVSNEQFHLFTEGRI
ncbi:MAG: PEP/pyruvate-binding domain-containing protein [Candidatus Contendobacter sp.]